MSNEKINKITKEGENDDCQGVEETKGKPFNPTWAQVNGIPTFSWDAYNRRIEREDEERKRLGKKPYGFNM
jgi:hypothetical protein